ncbi:hypothetical protein P171DRAFT_518070 [Karstenula rhodostoma CBS 690.94]|uniref:Uncharacterized protein n=1 Tax=Karstenula rhodostoma CBS 690.94 TaxID=1392251 RepID=A0A9P4UFY5_9PLEO|nr:hypothetical protein P171DRAFT_518070 [Karstenula rhodostoma CBS 690.94]
MTALETVTIASRVLLGWWNRNCPDLANVLPPSLVTICLTDDLPSFDTYEKYEDDLIPIIRKFVEGKEWRKTAPRLEEFNLRYFDQHSEWERKDESVALLV